MKTTESHPRERQRALSKQSTHFSVIHAPTFFDIVCDDGGGGGGGISGEVRVLRCGWVSECVNA